VEKNRPKNVNHKGTLILNDVETIPSAHITYLGYHRDTNILDIEIENTTFPSRFLGIHLENSSHLHQDNNRENSLACTLRYYAVRVIASNQ